MEEQDVSDLLASASEEADLTSPPRRLTGTADETDGIQKQF